MIIERIINYETDENCYLVYDKNKVGFIIDPGNKKEKIMDKVSQLGVNVKYIFLTHCHYDHIEGLEGVRKETGARVVSSFECNKNIQSANMNLSSLFSEFIEAMPSDEMVNDGDEITVGEMKVKAILTPGHTNGGVCYLVDKDLFSGDTLFLRSVGRWDFPTGDEETLKKSIINKLYVLDDEVIVHPGHGNDTKIHYEKLYNMFVKG